MEAVALYDVSAAPLVARGGVGAPFGTVIPVTIQITEGKEHQTRVHAIGSSVPGLFRRFKVSPAHFRARSREMGLEHLPALLGDGITFCSKSLGLPADQFVLLISLLMVIPGGVFHRHITPPILKQCVAP